MELSLEIIKKMTTKEYLENHREISLFLKPMRDKILEDNLKQEFRKKELKKKKLKKYNKRNYLKIKEKRLKKQEELRIYNELLKLKRRLLNNLRSRLSHSLKRNSKIKHTLDYIGCTLEELKNHLESQFTEGMNWENYGKWHIDHIKPCSRFDLSKSEEQQRKCFNFSNLQPLWAVDNIKKGGK